MGALKYYAMPSTVYSIGALKNGMKMGGSYTNKGRRKIKMLFNSAIKILFYF
jgi:hypothetical protein